MDDLVRTDTGLVRGSIDGGVREFQAIPYAAAPEGDLRWRSPQPAPAWHDILDATRPGDVCPQPAGIRPGTQSEDCLNLKVTTSSATPDRPKPVMVFLDAGGLVVSSNVGVDYRRLVTEGDVVVVQPNERVGLFGFLAHPQMDDPAAGSFGIADQQAALRWVQRNIAAFGGDPDNVTLFGVSGGGVSTCMNLVSPGAAGLFHRAIVHSGPGTGDFPSFVPGVAAAAFVRPLDQVESSGTTLARELGCADAEDVVTCLRSMPLTAFADHLGAGFGAIAHGNDMVPLGPAEALRTGRFNQMPIMMGTTRDECTFYVNLLFPDGIGEATYRGLLDDGTGTLERAFAQYPPGDYGGSAAAALSAAQTDRHFALRTWQSLQSLSDHVPVFAYEFADRTAPVDPGYDLPPQDIATVPYGAYHGSEYQYLIDNATYSAEFDEEQSRLVRQMIEYWTTFAHHGDPNTRHQPSWPSYDAAASVPHVQRLSTPAQGGTGPVDYGAEHRIEFWNGLYP